MQAFDGILFDILQLNQLRVDMEAIRDDLVVQYRQYCDDDALEEDTTGHPQHHHHNRHDDDGVQTFDHLYARKSSIFGYHSEGDVPVLLAGSKDASAKPIASQPQPQQPNSDANSFKSMSTTSKPFQNSPTTSSMTAKIPSTLTTLTLPAAASTTPAPSPATIPAPTPVAAVTLPNTLEGRYEVGAVLDSISFGDMGIGRNLPNAIVLKAGVSKVTRKRVLIKVITSPHL